MGLDLDPVDWAKGAYHEAKKAVSATINWAEAGLDDVLHALQGLVTLPDDALEEVIKALGLPWPDADENALHTMASTYTTMATALDTLVQGTTPSVVSLAHPANNSGKSVAAFEAFWTQYDAATGAPGVAQGKGWLPETADACRAQADACTKLAEAVSKQKTIAKATIISMAAVILISIGLLVVPGVDLLSGPAVAAATSACAGAVSACLVGISDAAAAIIADLLMNMAIGVVMSVTMDLAVAQPIKMAMGAQNGWDLSSLKGDVLYGAAGGAATFGLTAAGTQVLPRLATQLEDSAPTLSNLMGKAPDLLDTAGGRATVGIVTNVGTDAATGRPVTLSDVLMGATAAAGPKDDDPAGTPRTDDEAPPPVKVPELELANVDPKASANKGGSNGGNTGGNSGGGSKGGSGNSGGNNNTSGGNSGGGGGGGGGPTGNAPDPHGPKPSQPPLPADIHHSPASEQHILQGDGGKQGGHRPGTGVPGKTEFPKDWSDAKILAAIEETAKDPAYINPFPTKTKDAAGNPTWGWTYTRVVDGIVIEAVVLQDGEIRTGYPALGPGLIINPSIPKRPRGLAQVNGKFMNPDFTGGPPRWVFKGPKKNDLYKVYTDDKGNEIARWMLNKLPDGLEQWTRVPPPPDPNAPPPRGPLP